MNPHLVKRWKNEIEIILTISCGQQSIELSTNYRLNIKLAVRLFGRNDIASFKSKLTISFKVFSWTFTCETWKVVNITYFFLFTDNQECDRNLYKENMLSVTNKKVFKKRKDMILLNGLLMTKRLNFYLPWWGRISSYLYRSFAPLLPPKLPRHSAPPSRSWLPSAGMNSY